MASALNIIVLFNDLCWFDGPSWFSLWLCTALTWTLLGISQCVLCLGRNKEHRCQFSVLKLNSGFCHSFQFVVSANLHIFRPIWWINHFLWDISVFLTTFMRFFSVTDWHLWKKRVTTIMLSQTSLHFKIEVSW